MAIIGFLVNPIAGMGGKVGLKGTDNVLEKAIELGAKNISFARACSFVGHLSEEEKSSIDWLTCGTPMGENILKSMNCAYDVVYAPKEPTSDADTKKACRIFLENNCDILIFCGGDGTARDVYSVVGDKIPLLGIPSGVKMLSGVFAINPLLAAELLSLYLKNQASFKEAEIIDLDEEEYRKDNFCFKIFGIAKTVFEGNYLQSSKMLIEGAKEEEIKKDLAKTLIEDMEKDVLYLLGAGGTLRTIANEMNIKKTLLGIDAIKNKKMVKRDLNEKDILRLLKGEKRVKLVLSPIGAQGFIIGRGNLQLTPQVLELIGIENIIIVSTPSKLRTIDKLLVDTGDYELDKKFTKKRYLPVIVGYRTSTVKNLGTLL